VVERSDTTGLDFNNKTTPEEVAARASLQDAFVTYAGPVVSFVPRSTTG